MITNMPKVALSLNETGCQCGLAVFFFTHLGICVLQFRKFLGDPSQFYEYP